MTSLLGSFPREKCPKPVTIQYFSQEMSDLIYHSGMTLYFGTENYYKYNTDVSYDSLGRAAN